MMRKYMVQGFNSSKSKPKTPLSQTNFLVKTKSYKIINHAIFKRKITVPQKNQVIKPKNKTGLDR